MVGTAYLLFLRIPGVLFLLIWGILWSAWALMAAGGVTLIQTASMWAEEEEPKTHDPGQTKAVEYLGYGMFGTFFLKRALDKAKSKTC